MPTNDRTTDNDRGWLTVSGGGGGGPGALKAAYDGQAGVGFTLLFSQDINVGDSFRWCLTIANKDAICVDEPTARAIIGPGATGPGGGGVAGVGFVVDAGPSGTGEPGSGFLMPIAVNTEFGDTLILGYHQPISGRNGLQSLVSGMHITCPIGTSLNLQGGEVLIEASTEGGEIIHTTRTTSAGFDSGDVVSEPGSVALGSGDTKGAVVSRVGVGGGPAEPRVETDPIHVFESVELVKMFAGTSDPNAIALVAETGSVFARDSGASATSGRYVNTSAAGIGSQWFFVGGSGSTVLTWAAQFGGKLNAIGRHWAINGAPSAATPATLDPNTEITTPITTTVGLNWNSTGADATTEITVMKNGIADVVFALTGVSGTIGGIIVSWAPGDLIAMRYTAGTAPGDSNCQLIFGG